MDNTCKVCNSNFKDDRGLHGHLKSHKLLMAEYYRKYHPRYDLLSGELIFFKDKDWYFSHDFNSKENMVNWLYQQPNDAAREYCINLLKTRKEKYNLVYSPTQVELRSVMSPSIITLRTLFGDYQKLCSDLGFINKFIYSNNLSLNPTIPEGCKIIIDSREQLPLSFKTPTFVHKLEFGDYGLTCPDFNSHCFIERKSLPDFLMTVTRDIDRFSREIERADAAGAYLIVLVEQTLTTCLNFNVNGVIKSFGKVKPEFVFRNVRNLLQKYKNLQFLFVSGRETAVRVINKIFLSNDAPRKYDLQLLYDEKVL